MITCCLSVSLKWTLFGLSGNEQHHLSLCWSLRHREREHKICHKYTENLLGKRFVLLS